MSSSVSLIQNYGELFFYNSMIRTKGSVLRATEPINTPHHITCIVKQQLCVIKLLGETSWLPEVHLNKIYTTGCDTPFAEVVRK